MLVNQNKKRSSSLLLNTLQEIGLKRLGITCSEYTLLTITLLKYINSPIGCYEYNSVIQDRCNIASDKTVRNLKQTLASKIPLLIIKKPMNECKDGKKGLLPDQIFILDWEDPNSLEIAVENYKKNFSPSLDRMKSPSNEKLLAAQIKFEKEIEKLKTNFLLLHETYKIVKARVNGKVNITEPLRQNLPNPSVIFTEPLRQNLPRDNVLNSNPINNVCVDERENAPAPHENPHTQIEDKKIEDQRPKPSRIKDCLQPFIRNGDVPHTGFLDWNLFSDLRITNAQLMEVINLLKPGKDFIPYTTCFDPSALQRKIDSILSKSTNSNVQSIDEGALRAFNKKYPDGKVFEKGSGEAEHWEKFGLKLNYK